MKLALLALVMAVAASGQNRPVTAVGRITDTTFAGNLAASVQGTLPVRPVRFPPFLLLGPRYFGYGYPPYPDPSLFVPPMPSQPTLVVIQPQPPPYPAVPELAGAPAPVKADDNPVKIYSNPVVMAPPDEPPKPLARGQVVILALKNGGAETAIAYWTDGDQLKYITPARQQKQIALSQVDAALSGRLNRERGIPFLLTKVE